MLQSKQVYKIKFLILFTPCTDVVKYERQDIKIYGAILLKTIDIPQYLLGVQWITKMR